MEIFIFYAVASLWLFPLYWLDKVSLYYAFLIKKLKGTAK